MNPANPELPVVFLCHALGGSARAWGGVIEALGDTFECIAIDLPGFGGTPPVAPDVAATVAHVEGIVQTRGAARWLLVGHSMGGKIASIIAARTLAGGPGLYGLAGVVLLAGSPPSPEPMAEAVRTKMIRWAAKGPLDAAAAREFIDANIGSPLPAALDRLAVDDLQRCAPKAWRAWLEHGSREDWSARVGMLDLPALIVAGSEDGDALGVKGQRATNALVYPRAQLRVLEGAGHLLPLEQPAAVADAIRGFWLDKAGRAPAAPLAHARTIASDRVAQRMRAALARRGLADDPDRVPAVLTQAQLSTLRALAARVVPQTEPTIDLAARLDAQLADGTGDGWRFAELPSDAVAYAQALEQLDGFADLAADQQDSRLGEIAAGRTAPAADEPLRLADTPPLSAAQMQLWFQDACSDLVRLWLAHPATMARIGFDGYANGGDGPRLQGYTLLAADAREPWEPLQAGPR